MHGSYHRLQELGSRPRQGCHDPLWEGAMVLSWVQTGSLGVAYLEQGPSPLGSWAQASRPGLEGLPDHSSFLNLGWQ